MLKQTPNSDLEASHKVGLILRKKVLNKKPWKFEGDFRNFTESDLLIPFFEVAIFGLPELNEDEAADREVRNDAAILSQIFEASCRPERWKKRKTATNHQDVK